MFAADAARQTPTETSLHDSVLALLTQPDLLAKAQKDALAFARSREHVIDRVMNAITPLIKHLEHGSNSEPSTDLQTVRSHAF